MQALSQAHSHLSACSIEGLGTGMGLGTMLACVSTCNLFHTLSLPITKYLIVCWNWSYTHFFGVFSILTGGQVRTTCPEGGGCDNQRVDYFYISEQYCSVCAQMVPRWIPAYGQDTTAVLHHEESQREKEESQEEEGEREGEQLWMCVCVRGMGMGVSVGWFKRVKNERKWAGETLVHMVYRRSVRHRRVNSVRMLVYLCVCARPLACKYIVYVCRIKY